MKKLPEIIVPASGKKTWVGGAFTIAFVYAKSGNVVVKGYYKEVEEYIKKNYTHYFVKYTLWNNLMFGWNQPLFGKNCRTIIDFWKDDIGMISPSLRSKSKNPDKYKFVVRPWTSSFGPQIPKEELEAKTLRFKRLPNKWIKEFEIY